MCIDALDRDESCGAHFRVEHQTPDGEAQRDDERWCFVSAWEHGARRPADPARRSPELHRRARCRRGTTHDRPHEADTGDLAAGRHGGAGRLRGVRGGRRDPGDVAAGAAGPAQRRAGGATAGIRWRSTPTAARVSAARAGSPSTADRTGRCPTRRRAVSTCGRSPTARASASNRSGRRPSRWCAIWSWTARHWTGSSRPAGTSPSTPAPPPTRTPKPLPKDARRVRAGFRGLHRVRCVRGGLPERRRPPVRRCQTAAPGHRHAGPSGARAGGRKAWSARWNEDFGPCSSYGECAAGVPREHPDDGGRGGQPRGGAAWLRGEPD